MSLSRSLAEYAHGLKTLPGPVVHAIRRHLLDGISNAVASSRRGVVAPAEEVARGLGGPSEATLLGDEARIGAPAAALATGALVHGFDFDDTHADALVHATAVVLPVALAVGEQVDASLDELLLAAAAGYETTLRLGAAVPHGFHARGFHATSVVGVMGGTVVASRLLGVSVDVVVSALGIAGSRAAGSLEFLRSEASTKQLHPGFAAMDAILSTRLAAAGATGPPTILEGEAGLFRLYTGRYVDPATVLEGLGARWELERITIKPYPVCQLSHAALDAAATVLDRVDDPARIRRVVVELPADSVPIVAGPASEKVQPLTTYQARFALPFCLAVLLTDGAITIDDLGAAQLVRPDLQALAARVEVRAVEVGVTAAAAPGVVTVELQDGHVLEGYVPVSRGGPARPMTDADLLAKATANLGGSGEDARRLAEDLLDPTGGGSVRDLVRRVNDLARSERAHQGVGR